MRGLVAVAALVLVAAAGCGQVERWDRMSIEEEQAFLKARQDKIEKDCVRPGVPGAEIRACAIEVLKNFR